MAPRDEALVDRIGEELLHRDAVLLVGSELSRYSGLPDLQQSKAVRATASNWRTECLLK